LVDGRIPGDDHTVDFTVGHYQERIEPRLIKRFPAMTGGEPVRTWVTHAEPSRDGRAIVGAVPGVAGLFTFAGFSAISQCHVLAQAMAGLVIDGNWPTNLNLDELSESRFSASAESAARA
jgi:glycine/D-amino acid oxidase-like deaminating enzyme